MEELLLSRQVGWGRSAGERGGRVHGVSKLSGKCLSWFLHISGYLDCVGG